VHQEFYVEGWPKCCAMAGGVATCRYVDEEDSVLNCDVVENETSASNADGPEENLPLLASTPASLISSQA
jgi:hypothetical protein